MKNTLITGVVLAGGQGRRMGRVNKGLQLLGGKPLAAWVLQRFAPQVDEVLLNANQDEENYAALGYPVIGDLMTGFAGPLAGLHAALSHARHPLLATVPCDSPFLPADLVCRLASALSASGATIAVARAQGRLHPVFSLCRKSALPSLEQAIQREELRVGQWIMAEHHVLVDFDDQAAAFSNINTPEELARFAADRSL